MQRTTWIFLCTLIMYCVKMFIFVGGIRFFWHSTRQVFMILSMSSAAYKFGTSPALRIPAEQEMER